MKTPPTMEDLGAVRAAEGEDDGPATDAHAPPRLLLLLQEPQLVLARLIVLLLDGRNVFVLLKLTARRQVQMDSTAKVPRYGMSHQRGAVADPPTCCSLS